MTPPYGRKWRGTKERQCWWKRRVKKLANNSAFKKWRSWHPVPSHVLNRCRKSGNSHRFSFLELQNHCGQWLQPQNKRLLFLGRKAITNLDSALESRDITLPKKVHIVKATNFPVVMYECESWTIKKSECQRIDAFELWCWQRLLRVSLDSQEIKQVNPKGSQLWIFIGRTDAETEAPILWPLDPKSWLIIKDRDAEKDWGQEEKRLTDDEMVG